MRLVSKLAIAAFALGSLSTSASAAVNFSFLSGPTQLATPAGSTTVVDFDNPNASGWVTSGPVFTTSVTNIAAEPAGDASKFGAAEPMAEGGDFTITAPTTLTNLSIYVGSIDTYNSITFIGTGTLFSQTFTGTNLPGGLNSIGNGNQSANATNRRYFFTFGAADGVNKIVFSSLQQPAFEFDNVSILSGVPEPATWTMLILGFGFVGFMMRSNRQKTAMIAA